MCIRDRLTPCHWYRFTGWLRDALHVRVVLARQNYVPLWISVDQARWTLSYVRVQLRERFFRSCAYGWETHWILHTGGNEIGYTEVKKNARVFNSAAFSRSSPHRNATCWVFVTAFVYLLVTKVINFGIHGVFDMFIIKYVMWKIFYEDVIVTKVTKLRKQCTLFIRSRYFL